MIKFSGFADETAVAFEEQLSFLNSIGLEYIEIRFADGQNIVNIDEEGLSRIKNLLTQYGIGVSAVASPIGKVAIDEPFEPHFEKFMHTLEVARTLGTDMIRIFSFYAPKEGSIDDYRDEVIARLKKMAQEAEKAGIVLVHENEAHIYGHSAANCADIVRSVASPALQLAYDPANFVWGEDITDNVESCFPLMQQYVKHIHIKDWKKGSTDIGSLPGDGDGQIDELIGKLADTGYDGFISLEPHMSSGGQFGGSTTPEQFTQALQRVKDMCVKHGLRF